MKTVRFLSVVVSVIVFVLVSQACGSNGPEPINYGHDQCGHCRMMVSDARFGCQLATTKGRAYNFDDVQCMVAFVKAGNVAQEDVAAYYLPDYNHANQLMRSEDLFLLKS